MLCVVSTGQQAALLCLQHGMAFQVPDSLEIPNEPITPSGGICLMLEVAPIGQARCCLGHPPNADALFRAGGNKKNRSTRLEAAHCFSKLPIQPSLLGLEERPVSWFIASEQKAWQHTD